MATKRYVRETGGQWEIVEEGAKRGFIRTDTKAKAVAQARAIVGRNGGGEVRIVNEAGKVVRESRVRRAKRAA